jgi:periplasmic protein TonB
VPIRDKPLASFFVLSIVVHLFLVLLWSKPHPPVRQETIPVSLLPAPAPPPQSKEPEQSVARPTRRAKEVSRRASKAPAIIAKRDSPVLKETPSDLAPVTRSKETNEVKREVPTPPRQPPEERLPEERKLPTLKELLPPVTWSAAGDRNSEREGPIRLDTRNPQYITYFNSIKRDIEIVWQYPEPALRYGLQGKLLLEFSILANGELEGARIVRSSGSNLLDEEALRAIKTAAPFHPIPPWIDKKRIDIIASFEYLDNRLNYRFMP